MTYSLKLKNGDLVPGAKGLEVVDNASKMVQDIALELRQKMGENVLHPEYGSLIDGGVKPDGSTYPSIIGEDDLALVEMRVRSEISRIAGNYQSRQLARAKSDKMRYGSQTLTRGEILLGIASIDITQQLDKIRIVVALTTGENSTETIDILLDI
jgi:hypothetical protein